MPLSMFRHNPFRRAKKDPSSLSHSASWARPGQRPVRKIFGDSNPEANCSTPGVAQHHVPRPAPVVIAIPRTSPPPSPHLETAIARSHDVLTMSSYNPSSPTEASSLNSSRSSLSELSTILDDHHAICPTSPAKAKPPSPRFSLVDYDPSKTSENVWSFTDAGSKKLRQSSCIAAKTRATGGMVFHIITEQEVQDLKRRIAFEFTRYGNGRDSHLSLSNRNRSIEDAIAENTTFGSAHTDVSDVYLARLIREFSPKLTVTEMMSHILAWAGPVDKHARTKEEKQKRENKFEKLKFIILDMIKDIWNPSNGEELEKRFLSRKEYASAASRLNRGESLNETEIVRLLNTIKGLDILALLGKCLHHNLVDSADVTFISETLATHFCKEGYSFALYTLFKNAGNEICRGDSEKGACFAIDQAAEALYHNAHTYEDRDFHTRLSMMVDECRHIQNARFTTRTPKGRSDRRSTRREFSRYILPVDDLIEYL